MKESADDVRSLAVLFSIANWDRSPIGHQWYRSAPLYEGDLSATKCLKNMVREAYGLPGCALLRKKFKEHLFTYCIENGILLDSSDPSNYNTNVANALRELFVGNQDPGKNFLQSPPQINHHCCYECGDPLEYIYCHQCTCELCGRGAHYGYNCPLKVPVVPTLEPFNNQTVNELPQTLPSFDPTCYSEDGNSYTYDSTSNFVHDSPNVFSPSLQPMIYSYEFWGNDAYYGQDCSLQATRRTKDIQMRLPQGNESPPGKPISESNRRVRPHGKPHNTPSRGHQAEEGISREGLDLDVPATFPKVLNQGTTIQSHKGRDIQKGKRCSKDWRRVCSTGLETKKRVCPYTQMIQGVDHTIVAVEILKAATRVLAQEKQSLLLKNVITKEHPHEGRKRCQKAKVVEEDIGNQSQRDKSRVLIMTCPNHGKLPPAEKCIKDPVEIHNIKQRDGESTKEFVRRGEDGTEGSMIIEAEIGGHFVHRMYVDGGSSSEFLYEHYFNIFRPEFKSQMILATTPLVGFSGEIIWPLGKISLLVKIGDDEHSTSAWMNFMVVRQNGHITKQQDYSIRMQNGFRTRRTKQNRQALERNKVIYKEVEKLVDVGIMKEVHYHSWLSNPVMVKKHDGSWRMCMDFKDLNKACLKDGYPLPEIEWKVESLCGYPFKCILDAYKGYHQIKMAKEDEEKTAFITCGSGPQFSISKVFEERAKSK
uniref:Reverse transcriptase domain-containing protein n=1 Tax=Tanacetum cinerariifolium TaxID=118510 RepID=A0A6L2JRR9_TANCI|nr:reverse transcriptase domain-containing protein [Tanacetum cinerariifolium]